MTNSGETPEIGFGEFWNAIGVRAIGAAVVTARDNNGPAGFLGLSATHLSASPPILMVSVGKKTSALATLENSGCFAINYLAESDQDLADSFGGKGPLKGADRFADGRWTTLKTGAPVLLGAVGVLDCRLEETIERHETVIALGRLIAHTNHSSDLRPLISFAGGWHCSLS